MLNFFAFYSNKKFTSEIAIDTFVNVSFVTNIFCYS